MGSDSRVYGQENKLTPNMYGCHVCPNFQEPSLESLSFLFEFSALENQQLITFLINFLNTL